MTRPTHASVAVGTVVRVTEHSPVITGKNGTSGTGAAVSALTVINVWQLAEAEPSLTSIVRACIPGDKVNVTKLTSWLVAGEATVCVSSTSASCFNTTVKDCPESGSVTLTERFALAPAGGAQSNVASAGQTTCGAVLAGVAEKGDS
jgi:hypothetical protein